MPLPHHGTHSRIRSLPRGFPADRGVRGLPPLRDFARPDSALPPPAGTPGGADRRIPAANNPGRNRGAAGHAAQLYDDRRPAARQHGIQDSGGRQPGRTAGDVHAVVAERPEPGEAGGRSGQFQRLRPAATDGLADRGRRATGPARGFRHRDRPRPALQGGRPGGEARRQPDRTAHRRTKRRPQRELAHVFRRHLPRIFLRPASGARLLRAARAAARAAGCNQRAQFRNPETHAGADLQRMGPQGGVHRRRPRFRQGPLRPGAQSRAAGRDDHRRRRAANRRPALKTGRQRKPGPRGADGFRPETLYRQNESQRAAADRIVAAQYDGRLPDQPSGSRHGRGLRLYPAAGRMRRRPVERTDFQGAFLGLLADDPAADRRRRFRHAAAREFRKGVGAPPGADRQLHRRQAVLPFPALALPRPGAVPPPLGAADSEVPFAAFRESEKIHPETALRLYRGVAGSRRAAAGRRPLSGAGRQHPAALYRRCRLPDFEIRSPRGGTLPDEDRMAAAAQTGSQLRRRAAGRVHFHRAFLRTVAEPGTDGALPLPLLHLPQPLPALPDAVPFRRYGPQGNLPRQPLGTAGRFPAGKDSGRRGPQALRQRNLRLPDPGDAQRRVGRRADLPHFRCERGTDTARDQGCEHPVRRADGMYPDRRHAHVLPRGGRRIPSTPGARPSV